MQKKTELIYKIRKVTPVGQLRYISLSIAIFAREGPSDEICFHWHFGPGSAYTTITSSHNNFNLNKMLDKMCAANIGKQSQPEDVIDFLEKNKVSQAVVITIDPPGAKEPLSFLITEKEIRAREFTRGGAIYTFPPQAKRGLLKQLRDQQNF
jgi:hypothetical protein